MGQHFTVMPNFPVLAETVALSMVYLVTRGVEGEKNAEVWFPNREMLQSFNHEKLQVRVQVVSGRAAGVKQLPNLSCTIVHCGEPCRMKQLTGKNIYSDPVLLHSI